MRVCADELVDVFFSRHLLAVAIFRRQFSQAVDFGVFEIAHRFAQRAKVRSRGVDRQLEVLGRLIVDQNLQPGAEVVGGGVHLGVHARLCRELENAVLRQFAELVDVADVIGRGQKVAAEERRVVGHVAHEGMPRRQVCFFFAAPEVVLVVDIFLGGAIKSLFLKFCAILSLTEVFSLNLIITTNIFNYLFFKKIRFNILYL